MTAQDAPRGGITLARVVALGVIALLVGALGLVRVTHQVTKVSVPRGAQAGSLTLHSCTYATEAGDVPADCGTLVVPENRLRSGSRLTALPVTRIRAKTGATGAPVFYLQGGPGITNMTFPMASRYTANHDVVLVGYRGVDGSVRLDCPEVVSALTGTSDLVASKTLDAYNAGFRRCAARLTRNGTDLAGYNLVQRVEDFEAARTALGYKSINLISESAGTRTAMIYAWRHPQSLNRSVMLAVNPPGHFLYDGATTDAQLRRYGEACAQDSACRSRTANLVAEMRDLSPRLPDRWLFLPIKSGNVRLASFFGLADTTSAASPLSGPQVIDSWNAAAHGDSSGLWLLSLLGDLAIPTSHVWGDVAATAQLDFPAADAYYRNGGGQSSILRDSLGDHLWGGGGLASSWPHSSEVDQYAKLQPTDVPTLLISGELDFVTPAQVATRELLPSLHRGHQVVLRNLGHTEDTWNYQKGASNRLINGFFDTGRVDESGYTARAMSFQASPSHTMIAKIALTSLAGLIAFSIIVALWLVSRLRRRGSVGRKTGIVTRTVLAHFAGLGGFALGVLVLLTAWPTVDIAYAPVDVLAIAGPVAVVVYLAWVHRSWRRSIRVAGLCAVTAGAVGGAWLGLQVAPGMTAALTAVLGAVLGANAALLAHDIARGARPVAASHINDADALPSPVLVDGG
ncbi:MAG: hypothetical protein QOE05_3003 [Actinomycetota bacterium]|jgi:pimeloyl-ACP methyl ester carboxylesterase|nr:hypothetical protein [Actinomycetota bacterium]